MINSQSSKQVVLRTFENGFYQIKSVPYVCIDEEIGLYYLTPAVMEDLAVLTKQMQKTEETVQVFPAYSETH